MISIELSDQECLIFRLLAEARALDDMKGGSLTIHFDYEGNPRHIDVTKRTVYPHIRL